jgi:DNA-binding PadR family transcriptional regulator
VGRSGSEATLSIKHALLGLLARGEQHGYELKAAVEADLVPLSPMNFGQVYAALDKLERDGFVSHRSVEQAERPTKKVYRLTDSGRRELTSWMRGPSTPDLDLRNATFLKLTLARMLPAAADAPDPLDVIRAERRAGFERLHEVAAARARAGDGVHTAEVSLLLDKCETVFGPGERGGGAVLP